MTFLGVEGNYNVLIIVLGILTYVVIKKGSDILSLNKSVIINSSSEVIPFEAAKEEKFLDKVYDNYKRDLQQFALQPFSIRINELRCNISFHKAIRQYKETKGQNRYVSILLKLRRSCTLQGNNILYIDQSNAYQIFAKREIYDSFMNYRTPKTNNSDHFYKVKENNILNTQKLKYNDIRHSKKSSSKFIFSFNGLDRNIFNNRCTIYSKNNSLLLLLLNNSYAKAMSC